MEAIVFSRGIAATVSLHLAEIKDRARRLVTSERMVGVAVTTATLLILGYLGEALYHGLETYTMVGF